MDLQGIVTTYVLSILLIAMILMGVISMCCWDVHNRGEQPAGSADLRETVAQPWAEWQAAAAASTTGKVAAPPVLLPLPYFPYAARPKSDEPSETVECAICLEQLRPGQLCSEVPPCRHVFHGDCLRQWARTNGSWPMCRGKIVPGSEEVAVADDMV